MVNQTISPAQSLYQEDLYLIPGKILIVLSKDWALVTLEEQTTLAKMLAALRLNLATVQIVTRQKFSINDLASFSPAKVLAFGVAPAEAPNLYEFTQVNGLPVLAAEAIDKLDDAKKKTLWLELRKMFGV